MHDLYMLRILVKNVGSSGSGAFSTSTKKSKYNKLVLKYFELSVKYLVICCLSRLAIVRRLIRMFCHRESLDCQPSFHKKIYKNHRMDSRTRPYF